MSDTRTLPLQKPRSPALRLAWSLTYYVTLGHIILSLSFGVSICSMGMLTSVLPPLRVKVMRVNGDGQASMGIWGYSSLIPFHSPPEAEEASKMQVCPLTPLLKLFPGYLVPSKSLHESFPPLPSSLAIFLAFPCGNVQFGFG